MKETRRLNYFLSLVMTMTLLAACDSQNDQVSAGSNLNTNPPNLNALDQWIDENFVQPYNIEVVYQWDNSLHDLGRYFYPPTIDSVKPALEVIKQIWIDPYNEVGGADFVKKVAPRQLVLIGGKNRNPDGTRTLGVAESGKRVTLFEVDQLNKKSRESLNRFMHTIQHEYVHILNQTKPFKEVAYRNISPEGYTPQWYNMSNTRSWIAGFISAYARSNVSEDFAETASAILTRNKTQWDSILALIPESGRDKIKRKEALVANYYKKDFNVDMHVLQDKVYRATTQYLNTKNKK